MKRKEGVVGGGRFVWLLLVVLALCGVEGSLDRSDAVIGASHPYESWSRPPQSGWGGGGGTAGSYYHYHVPLVGQQQGWGWAAEGGKGGHDILLWVLVGLLALAALGSLLLPLLLIPLGLSLLALLMGGMMMMAGGGMMMMMMMMMMPQPQAARTELVGRALETVSKMVAGDTEGAVSNILSTLELESYCPDRAVCNMGHSLAGFPLPGGLGAAATEGMGEGVQMVGNWGKKGWSLVSPYFLPAMKNVRLGRMVKRMEKAFWAGLLTGNCARLEKRCKRLREKNHQNHQNHTHHDYWNFQNGTTTTTTTTTETPPQLLGENDAQPHVVIVDEHNNNHDDDVSHHFVRPTFSTPTILV